MTPSPCWSQMPRDVIAWDCWRLSVGDFEAEVLPGYGLEPSGWSWLVRSISPWKAIAGGDADTLEQAKAAAERALAEVAKAVQP